MILHIVAAAENNVIGLNNDLPWRLPNDLKHFKNQTWGMPIIMGRNTFESFKKPLKGRRNIVLTRQKDWQAPGTIVVHDMEEALAKARETDARNIYIIGGGEIFKDTMDIVDQVYLTRVHAQVEGDTKYPELNEAEWTLMKSESYPADEKNKYAYTFELWQRKR